MKGKEYSEGITKSYNGRWDVIFFFTWRVDYSVVLLAVQKVFVKVE